MSALKILSTVRTRNNQVSYLHGVVSDLETEKRIVVANIERDYPCGWAPASRVAIKGGLTTRIKHVKREIEELRNENIQVLKSYSQRG